ncbi:hypothetical protein QWZ10_08190 [Paracoccus cavernae]|uniref:Uncharacterized protein n=1 Tax=Paracoccus cavernae TaxID=1571207 RepID=A0ABT8D4V3_9RHOB|nr:hypothetical protein [Paracoccus cavernae]
MRLPAFSRSLGLAALLAMSGAALADAPVFVIDQSQLPFDLGPGAPENAPARQSNLPSAAGNSSANAANSSAAYANSPNNPANSKRVLFTAEGEVVGYYAENGSGTLNVFTATGKRAFTGRAGRKACSPTPANGAARSRPRRDRASPSGSPAPARRSFSADCARLRPHTAVSRQFATISSYSRL